MTKNKYNYEYFDVAIEKYGKLFVKKNEAAFLAAIEGLPSLSTIDNLENIAHLIMSEIPLREMQKELVEAYEIYTKLGATFEDIVENGVVILQKYKDLANPEYVDYEYIETSNEVIDEEEVNNTPLEQSDLFFNEERYMAMSEDFKLLFAAQFINEESLEALEKEIEGFMQNLVCEDEEKIETILFQHKLSLLYEYQKRGLYKGHIADMVIGIKLRNYLESLTHEQIDSMTAVDVLKSIHPNAIIPEKDALEPNEADESLFLMQLEGVNILKEIARNLNTDKEKLLPLLYKYYEHSVLAMKELYTPIAEALGDKVSKEVAETIKLGMTNLESYRNEIQIDNNLDIPIEERCSFCRSSIYEIDFEKDLKQECFKFFVHYETFKTIRYGKLQDRKLNDTLDAIMDSLEGLSKPTPPRVNYEQLVKSKRNTTSQIKTIVVKKALPKIEWRGTARQLYDLFLALYVKSWIAEIDFNLITNYFENAEGIEKFQSNLTEPSLFKDLKVNVKPKEQEKDSKKNEGKIVWLGTRRNLGDLFVILHTKKWIRVLTPKLVMAYFTNSNALDKLMSKTKEGEDIKTWYANIYNGNYISKFDKISQK
ncbi:MAG: hypothetical protein ACKVTZ_04090 [Bacteroidia bacterium]